METHSFEPPISAPVTAFRAPLRLCWLLLASIGAGCATHPISQPLRRAAANQPSFAELLAQPDAFKGRTVILGGEIIETRNLPKQTEIEVLQKPLDSSDRPQAGDRSWGRFLIQCRQFLDPAIYAKGREVTVAGDILGKEMKPLGQIDYTYPTVGCQQIQLWSERSAARYYYAPPYGYSPWWGGWPGWYPYWYPYW